METRVIPPEPFTLSLEGSAFRYASDGRACIGLLRRKKLRGNRPRRSDTLGCWYTTHDLPSFNAERNLPLEQLFF